MQILNTDVHEHKGLWPILKYDIAIRFLALKNVNIDSQITSGIWDFRNVSI